MNTLRSVLVVSMVFTAALVNAQEKPEGFAVDQAKQVKLYHNPAIEFLIVKFEAPQAKKAKLALHNIIGNELEAEYEITDDYEVRVRVKDLSSGVYLLLVRNEETGLKGAYKFLKK